jgi:hypothetical protein
MRHYCTLTDSKYLPRMLAMYESLKRHSSEAFMLHVLALDAETEAAVKALSLPSVTVTQWIWDSRRTDHTWQEYCWLMASQWAEKLIDNGHFEITYLDADLFFFSDPVPVFDEIGGASIGIIPHRFIKSKRYLERNGVFNVGWVTFRNTAPGRDCLFTWARNCRTWCYSRNEDGKFGDQKYLDAWPEAYGMHLRVISNIGAGLAPWNLANYRLAEGPAVDGVPVVFYHFHEYEHGKRLTNYALRPEDKRIIYEPYVVACEAAKETLEAIHIQA